MEKTKIGGGVQVSKERNNIGEKQSKIYKGRCAGQLNKRKEARKEGSSKEVKKKKKQVGKKESSRKQEKKERSK